MQELIDLYVNAINLAKEKRGLSNQDKRILNLLKILLLKGSIGEADMDFSQWGKVKKSTIHKMREFAESLYENSVRNCEMSEAERDRIINEGKMRADMIEEIILHDCHLQDLIIDD